MSVCVKRWQIVYASLCASLYRKRFKGLPLLKVDCNMCNDCYI